MITNFVLFDPSYRVFVAAGKGLRSTYSLNNAKHFTSEWSAQQFQKKNPDLECYLIRKIVRY